MMRSIGVRQRGGPNVFHRQVGAVIAAALLAAIFTASCSDDSDSSGCDEVHALQDSLTALTQVDPLSDGTEALKAAATQVGTDLDAAASAVSSELKPSVDQVKAAFDGLESAIASVSSGGGLGEAATTVSTSLTQLGTALTSLTTEVGQIC
jgi:hypothetical protein